jgi:hypothetical protein
MKKIFWVFFLSLIILSFFSAPILTHAKACTGESANGLVPCGQDASCPCEISDFFTMIGRIYNFIVKMVATPLAILALTVGGIVLLISAGSPGLAGLGRKILYTTVIGMFLVYGSWIIIDLIVYTLTKHHIQ